MASARISLTTGFESAHFLPNVADDHRCKRLHGHTFRCEFELHGAVDAQMGWVQDFGLVEACVDQVVGRLDHRLLNDIEGLENPTSEHVALWLYRALIDDLPALASVTVWENPRMRAQVTQSDVDA